jgi:hypothetical protein
MNKIYLNWEDVNFVWGDINMPWDEVIKEVAEVIRKHGGMSAYVNGNPWDIIKKELGEEKTKKFIKIFCKINGLEYEKTIENLQSFGEKESF